MASYAPYREAADDVTDDAVSNSIVGYTRRPTSPLSEDLSDEEAGLTGTDESGVDSSDAEEYYEERLSDSSASPNLLVPGSDFRANRGRTAQGSLKPDFVPPDRAELYRLGGIPGDRVVSAGGYAPLGDIGAKMDMSGEGRGGIRYGETKFATADRGETTILMIKSEDRDLQAYPQPTNFQLHFPRVYRNVTDFAVTQIKLLTSFLYFREQKYNTHFDVYELGRQTLTGESNIIRVQIREGSYNINTLLTELQYQMNTPPIFFHYPDNFNGFVAIFTANGDLAANFTLPGDYFYDAQLQRFITNPTTDYIVTRYFKSRYAGLASYTLDQILVAYYYPVLKEALMDPFAALAINLPPNDANAYIRIVYQFQGLDDSYVLNVINQNIAALDDYRDKHTFQYYLTNNYQWTVNPNDNRVTVVSSNLNTSIVNNINTQQALYLNNALAAAGYTQAQFISTATQASRYNAIVNSMYNFVQEQYANYFAINIGSYTLNQLASLSTQIYVQDGCNVSGIYSAYTPAYLEALGNGTIKPLPNFDFKPSSPTIQWPNMSNLANPTTDVTVSSGTFLVNFNAGDTYNIYDFTLSNIDVNTYFTDSNGYIQADVKYGSANVVANVSAGQYAIFGFRSPARQTLQVETLPRPYIYRYPAYNSNGYSGAIPFYFSNDYEFTTPIGVDTTAGLTATTFSSLTYGLSRASTLAAASTYTLNTVSNVKYFSIDTPAPPTLSTATDYLLNFEIAEAAGSSFSTTLGVFIYHDRGGFMADAAVPRAENQLNYITSAFVSGPASTVTIPLTVMANGTYYITVRPNPTGFPTTNFNLLPYWTDVTPRQLLCNFDIVQPGVTTFSEQFGEAYADTPSTVNYYFYKTYNQDFIRLPIQSNLYGSNPSQSQFNFQYPSAGPVIGYDDNDVSDDLTDYKGFIPGLSSFQPSTIFNGDPITQYLFQSRSPYNTGSNIQSYFYSTTSNVLLTPQILAEYTPVFSNVTERQYKIVHYWDPTFIGPQIGDGSGYSLAGLPTLSTMKPYTSSTTNGTLASYEYEEDAILGSTLRLGLGVCGISFLPSDGTWDAQSLTFKSAYMGANDPNDNIAYIGIFDMNAVTDIRVDTINLSSALAVLSCVSKVEYTPAVVASNNGFDPSYGTWRSFERVTNFPYSRPDLVAAGLGGYTPYPSSIIAGEKNHYTALAFTASGSVANYFMLCGSATPNPANSIPVPSTGYFNLSNTYGMVWPSTNGTWTGTCNFYQSKYQQSIPIGTQILNYITELPLIEDDEAMFNYDPFGGYIGASNFTLRTAAYMEGGVKFLLFGDPLGVQPEICDIYFIRYPGNVFGERASVFVNQVNLKLVTGMPASIDVITWGASQSAVYVVTRPSPAPSDQVVNIYKVTALSTAPVATFFQQVEMVGWNYFGTNGVNKASFSTSAARITVNDTESWMYTDNMIRSTSTSNINSLKGVIIYNNPGGVSSFTSQSYAVPGNAFTSNQHYFDASMHSGGDYAYVLYDDSVNQEEYITKFALSTPSDAISSINGYLMTANSTTSYQVDTASFIIGQIYYDALSNIAVTSDDILYGLTYDSPTRFQQLLLSPTGVATVSNVQLIGSAASISSITGTSAFGWAIDMSNGIYFSYNRGSVFDPSPIQITGNTRQLDDLHEGMKAAYQIFYPTMKIGLTKRNNRFNDITDLTDIDYFGTPFYENYKTAAFYYPNFSTLLTDLKGPGGWKWGMESASSYLRGDTTFNGYGFNSYIYNINLSTSGPATAPVNPVYNLSGDANNYQWIAIRGYSPTENLQTIVRFNLINRYDYGIVTQSDLFTEISTVTSTLNLSNYNPDYVTSLLDFDMAFKTTRTYGQNALSNFAGSTITTTGFSNWFTYFSTFYYTANTLGSTIAGIDCNVNSNLLNYISTYYGTILPSTIYTRTQITDATPYDLLFSTSISPQLAGCNTFWGLGYNLGFSGCLFPAVGGSPNCYGASNYTGNTVYTAPSFYKILEDYIYLQLNDELNMNKLDITREEDYNVSLESTGEVSKYNAKLLLGNFGQYSQTAIQNPVRFNPPLSRLDRLTFRWVDVNGQVVDNNDCEWSASLQITEQKNVQTTASTLPSLK